MTQNSTTSVRIASTLAMWTILSCAAYAQKPPEPNPGAARAQKPHAPNSQIFEFTRATLRIVSIEPAAPVADAPITVSYEVHAAEQLTKAITGIVGGHFSGSSLGPPGGGPPKYFTLQPGGTVSGKLVIQSPTAGAGRVALTFGGEPICTGVGKVGINGNTPGSCTRTILATAERDLTVEQPIVTVRIAGSTYAKLTLPDSGDHSTAASGFQCVTHNPGCGWKGNNGDDTFFVVKALPPGVRLQSTEFLQYWPAGLNANDAGSRNALHTGSYGATINRSVPEKPTVLWNNTCWATFNNKNVNYSISFLLSMRKGTSVGEQTFDPSEKASPCLPEGYSAVPPTIRGTPQPPGEVFMIDKGAWFQGTFTGPGGTGKILTITNPVSVDMEVIADSNMPGGCGKPGNKVLAGHETIQAADFYQGAVNYPKVMSVCMAVSTTPPLQVRTAGLQITYAPD